MRAYVNVAGAIFGLLTLVHIWHIVLEPRLATDPWFILITLASGALCFGAWRVTRRSRIGILLLLCCPSPARGQDPLFGQHVRARGPASQAWIVGTVNRIDRDSIVLTVDSGTLRVARSSLVRLDVSQGRHGRLLAGAVVGSLAGLAVGLPVALNDRNDLCGLWAPADWVCPAAIVGSAVAGAGVGLAIGALVRTERWGSVPLSPHSIRIVPGSRTQVAAAWSFSLTAWPNKR